MQKLEIDGIVILIEYKNIKNMYLKVRRNGEVLVTAPTHFTKKEVEAFVRTKQTWLEAKVKKSQSLNRDEWVDFQLFGERIEVVEQIGIKSFAKLSEGILVIQTKEKLDEHTRKQIIQQLFHQELTLYIQQLVTKYQPHILAVPNDVTIKYREMKSTWGVCRPQRPSITFNKRLVHYRRAFIEYVVVHELCHFVYPHHQASFYALVESLLPDWKLSRRP